MMQVPAKLLRQGAWDILRISDARMSGTHFGTVVLHAAPEAALGGGLALMRNGDMIALDADECRIELHVPDAELAARRAAWNPPASRHARSWARLYTEGVLQADTGADLDFLLDGPRLRSGRSTNHGDLHDRCTASWNPPV